MLTELAPHEPLGAAESEHDGVFRLRTGEFLTFLVMAASAHLKTWSRKGRPESQMLWEGAR